MPTPRSSISCERRRPIRRRTSENSILVWSSPFLVSNKDDHLKNHGFLYVGGGRWRLSPVFDVNPAPDRNPHLETAILEGGAHDRSIRLALDACDFFEITEPDARRIIRDTAQRISDGWREALRQVGVTGSLARDYEPAFLNAETEIALML